MDPAIGQSVYVGPWSSAPSAALVLRVSVSPCFDKRIHSHNAKILHNNPRIQKSVGPTRPGVPQPLLACESEDDTVIELPVRPRLLYRRCSPGLQARRSNAAASPSRPDGPVQPHERAHQADRSHHRGGHRGAAFPGPSAASLASAVHAKTLLKGGYGGCEHYVPGPDRGRGEEV